MDAPLLFTPSLVLRPFGLEDAAVIFALSREQGLRTWLPDQVYPTEEAARAVLAHLIACYEDPGTPARGPYVLAVCRRDSGAVIGHVGLSPVRGDVEIGYAIAEAEQGHGHATCAVRTAAGWALQRFGLGAIHAIVAAENVASCRVLERAGFVQMEESMRSMHGTIRLVRTYRRSEEE